MKKPLASFLAASVLITGLLLGFAQPAQAATVEELQAQIQALLNTIAQLQAQIAALQGQPQAWCYTFNQNIHLGDRGAAVYALQTALQKQGFTIGAEVNEQYFGEQTASSVVGFQQKYQSAILAPFGLQFGTGFVGTSTRAKLNSLYGCGSIQSPIARPTRESRTTPTSAPESSPHSAATSTPSQTSTADISQITPQMMYPADGQVLNYGVPHGYMFKVNPITGATGYHYQFIQNGAVVYDNASSLSSNGEFAFWPGQSGYSSLAEGSVTVKINAVAGDQSSAARTITITLGRADLYPTSITTPSLTETIKAGDQVFFDSGIGNRGVVSTGVFNIKWFVDEAQVGYGSHSGVPANTTLMDGNSQYSWTAVAGTHIIKFMVDADSFVNESDETNNIVSTTISVPTP